jgi:hypothetical protein
VEFLFSGRSVNVAGAKSRSSADIFDDLDQLVEAITVPAGKIDELLRPLDDGAPFGRPRDRDATPAPELEQPIPRGAAAGPGGRCSC